MWCAGASGRYGPATFTIEATGVSAGRNWRDLMPLCRIDHHALHALLEADPAWRRLGRPQASDLIAAKLRDRHRRGAQR